MVTISATSLSSRKPPTAQGAPSRRTRIIKTSIQTLTLLLAVGVACTTGSNLRRRHGAAALPGHRVRDDGDDGDEAPPAAAAKQLRSSSAAASAPAAPPPSALKGPPAAAAAAGEAAAPAAPGPSLALDRSAYVEGQPITATFSVGPPSHPYYSGGDAPSALSELDFDYPRWSVGLFMRDADPQGGTLGPIVRVDACVALGGDGCDGAGDRGGYARYSGLRVTFGSERPERMRGRWPIENSDYGTGFDAYVLDGKGAAAIGPLEFTIRENEEDVPEDAAEGTVYRPGAGAGTPSAPQVSLDPGPVASNPLLKYRKGTKKATARQHAGVAEAPPASRASIHIAGANGPETSSDAVPSDGSVREVGGPAGPSRGTISSDKGEYEEDEPVSIAFSLESPEGGGAFSGYRIGIFMRASRPRGGALAPVVSLPLCPAGDGCAVQEAGRAYSGSVTFGPETMAEMAPAPQWPIDLHQWGTGFHAYVLDENGADVVGPVEFDIRMSDTH